MSLSTIINDKEFIHYKNKSIRRVTEDYPNQ